MVLLTILCGILTVVIPTAEMIGALAGIGELCIISNSSLWALLLLPTLAIMFITIAAIWKLKAKIETSIFANRRKEELGW